MVSRGKGEREGEKCVVKWREVGKESGRKEVKEEGCLAPEGRERGGYGSVAERFIYFDIAYTQDDPREASLQPIHLTSF